MLQACFAFTATALELVSKTGLFPKVEPVTVEKKKNTPSIEDGWTLQIQTVITATGLLVLKRGI